MSRDAKAPGAGRPVARWSVVPFLNRFSGL